MPGDRRRFPSPWASTAFVTIASAATFVWWRRRQAVHAAAPELRTADLYLPLMVNNDRVLRICRRLLQSESQPVTGVEVERQEVPGHVGDQPVPVYLYRPLIPSGNGALVWMHGGGRVAGTPEGEHERCSFLAREAGVLVVSVDYRLAPEHPFPAGFDDCVSVLRWLHEHADELDVDPRAIAVGGGSAGGGLAAELAQRATDDGLPVAFQLLLYPMLDDRTGTLDPAGRGRLIWTPTSNRYAWSRYLGHPPGIPENRAYAVAARRESLDGLPPAWIGVGDLDLLFEENLAYAARLRAAGVACDLHIEPAMYHGADALHETSPAMAEFRQRMAEALKRGLTVAD